jgi:hypothetical protein
MNNYATLNTKYIVIRFDKSNLYYDIDYFFKKYKQIS